MGGSIPKERWGKSMMDNGSDGQNSEIVIEIQSDQQSVVNKKLRIENFPDWLYEMLKKHGLYNSPEKLEFDQTLQQTEEGLEESDYFLGFTLNQQKHGYGVLLLKGVNFYEGNFKYGNKQGWGRQLEQNQLMQGYWEENQIVRDKKITTGNETYFGEFQDNCPHGKGTMIFEQEEEIYEGDFNYGVRGGKGILKNLKYDCQYDGDFKNNKMEGKGIFLFGNGMEYEGEFLNNQMHGKGYLKYPDGTYYKGDFFENKIHGYGILKGIDEIYDGEFENGQKNGYGKIIVNKFEVVGKWKNNKLQEQSE